MSYSSEGNGRVTILPHRALFAPVIAAAILIGAGTPGCRRSAPAAPRVDGAPPAPVSDLRPRHAAGPPTGGSVRIKIARKQITPGSARIRWEIATDREWSNLQAGPNGLEMSVASPPGRQQSSASSSASSSSARSSRRTYAYDLTLAASAGTQGATQLAYRYTVTLPGGTPARTGEGIVGRRLRAVDLRRALEVRFAREQALLLPAEEPLVQINVRETGGAALQQEFRLILAP